jgi:hypothetical protein
MGADQTDQHADELHSKTILSFVISANRKLEY